MTESEFVHKIQNSSLTPLVNGVYKKKSILSGQFSLQPILKCYVHVYVNHHDIARRSCI